METVDYFMKGRLHYEKVAQKKQTTQETHRLTYENVDQVFYLFLCRLLILKYYTYSYVVRFDF